MITEYQEAKRNEKYQDTEEEGSEHYEFCMNLYKLTNMYKLTYEVFHIFETWLERKLDHLLNILLQ